VWAHRQQGASTRGAARGGSAPARQPRRRCAARLPRGRPCRALRRRLRERREAPAVSFVPCHERDTQSDGAGAGAGVGPQGVLDWVLELRSGLLLLTTAQMRDTARVTPASVPHSNRDYLPGSCATCALAPALHPPLHRVSSLWASLPPPPPEHARVASASAASEPAPRRRNRRAPHSLVQSSNSYFFGTRVGNLYELI
jgi:hypothetical protein